MTTLWLDLETFSECDLKAHGTHRYAEHPSTEVIMAQWAVDDGEPVVADCTVSEARQFAQGVLLQLLETPSVVVIAHNSHFDRTILRHVWGIDIPVERWQDTMVKAMAHGLPGGLGKIGEVLGLPLDQAKDKRGKELIQLFCKPRPKNSKLRRATRETHPTEWAEFLEYSRQDIVAMRAIDQRLPSWNYRAGHPELALWHLDQRINDRGFAVDVALAKGATAAAEGEKQRLKAEVVDLTDGAVTSVSKRDQLLKFILEEYGVTLPDMRADTLRRRLEDPELPEAVKLLISIRLEATKTSTAKYKALTNAVSADGRLRNTMQFCGAQRTGRVAHRQFQPGNMPRPNVEHIAARAGVTVKELQHQHILDYIGAGVAALKAGAADLVFDDVMQLTANLVRGCIVAEDGRKITIADLTNIEGRGLAWLAGEEWKLRAFGKYDEGTGPDLYNLAYARSFNVDPMRISKDQRQQGKVQELACLAGDTPVITDRGIIRLDSVTKGHKVWDGTQWVQHQGLISRGMRETLNLAGIEVTPDHLIKTQLTWRPALELAFSESTLHQALATGSESLPWSVWSAISRALAGWTSSGCNARAALRLIWSTTTTSARAQAPAATSALKNRRGTGGKSSGGTPTSSQTTTTACGYSTASPPASTDATTRTTQVTPTTEGGVSKCTRHGAKTGGRFLPIWSPLRAGISLLSNWIGARLTKATNPATSGSSQSARTKATGALSGRCRLVSPNLKPVFDLAHAGPNNRFTVLTDAGPLIVHNCGYEGGPAAYLTMAAVYQMDLDALADNVLQTAPESELHESRGKYKWALKKNRTGGLDERVYVACQTLVSLWRAAHPATVALWRNVGDAVRQAIRSPGTRLAVRDLVIQRDGAWLRIRLPSGRVLCYLNPQVDDKDQISYMGVNQYTRQWARIKTYGGKLVENITQAFARDVLFHNMPAVEAAGYEILLSVHDELLTETPDTPEYSAETLASLMSIVPPWAAGLPLSAAGFETARYRKD